MPQHFKVHELLSRQELDELEAFAREPGRTIDETHVWLQAKGYTLGRTAVGNWLRKFRMEDRFRVGADLAKSLVETAKQEGTVAISDAATLQLSTMLMEKLLQLQAQETAPTKELWGISMALKNVIAGKRHVEKLKGEIADAISAAEQKASKGATAGDVVATIKKALGIAA
jgi:hypothetical protein